jgi:hypothetical protein
VKNMVLVKYIGFERRPLSVTGRNGNVLDDISKGGLGHPADASHGTRFRFHRSLLP